VRANYFERVVKNLAKEAGEEMGQLLDNINKEVCSKCRGMIPGNLDDEEEKNNKLHSCCRYCKNNNGFFKPRGEPFKREDFKKALGHFKGFTDEVIKVMGW